MKNYISLKSEGGWTVKVDLTSIPTESIGSLVKDILDETPGSCWNWKGFKVGEGLWYADGSMVVKCSKVDIRKNVIEFR